ncbi:hypothetical protein Tco_1313136 [Tanacetum coccineum]
MAATTNWDFLIDKFSKRLSNWKASMLSIGGRTTLFLFSLNQALILKWRWRFFQNPNALWVRVIKAVHGGPGLDNSFYSHVRDQGVWGRIAKSINAMHEKGIIPLSFLRKRVGNGTDTKFWQDVWIGEISLQSKFPRLYRLALNKECSICEVWNNGWVFNWSRPILRGTLLHQLNDLTAILDSVQFSDSEDSWIWSLGFSFFYQSLQGTEFDKDALDLLPTIFLDDKLTRTIALKVTAVTYAINGLSKKFAHVAEIIAHRDPFPDLATVRSMVTT